MKNKRIQIGVVLVVMLLISMAFVPFIGAQTAQDVGATTWIDCPCSQGVGIADDSGANVDVIELSGAEKEKFIDIGGTNKKVYQANEINVYELFNAKPHKLPVPLLRYDNAKDDLKNEIESFADKANIKSDDTIVGILKYNNQKIVLIDSVDTVTEIVADAQDNIVATYQLEPKLIGSKEYINEESSITVKTIVELYQLDIIVPNRKTDSIEILTTDIIVAENSAWKELGLGCPICLLVDKDMNVIAKGEFIIDYGNEVESVAQQSTSETNCKACLSRCSLDKSTSGGDHKRQVDATVVWAANLAPVTANFEIFSWVSVDKFGTMDSGASDDSWLTPGFGCYAP
jgi:hypothetical protein